MADTAANTRHRTRVLLNDLDSNNYAIQTFRLDGLLQAAMNHISQRVGLPLEWVTGAVTLALNTRDYALSSAIQYDRIASIVRSDDKAPLQRLSLEAMESEVYFEATGAPTAYCLLETHTVTSTVTVRIDTKPAAADVGATLDILRAPIPNRLTTDATVIPFTDPLLRALEKSAAADALESMGPHMLKITGLNPSVTRSWRVEAEVAIKLERVRRNRLRRLPQIEKVEA